MEADLETRSETQGLLGVLGSEFARAFGDCWVLELFRCLVGVLQSGRLMNLLSSCRLSIRACFCTCVMRIVFLGGLVVGVRDGLSMFVSIMLREIGNSK